MGRLFLGVEPKMIIDGHRLRVTRERSSAEGLPPHPPWCPYCHHNSWDHRLRRRRSESYVRCDRHGSPDQRMRAGLPCRHFLQVDGAQDAVDAVSDLFVALVDVGSHDIGIGVIGVGVDELHEES